MVGEATCFGAGDRCDTNRLPPGTCGGIGDRARMNWREAEYSGVVVKTVGRFAGRKAACE